MRAAVASGEVVRLRRGVVAEPGDPGAVSLLLWAGIELAQSLGLWFDFDGGITNDARYRFVVAFGGEVANRFDVTRSTANYRVRHTLRRIPGALMRRISVQPAVH